MYWVNGLLLFGEEPSISMFKNWLLNPAGSARGLEPKELA